MTLNNMVTDEMSNLFLKLNNDKRKIKMYPNNFLFIQRSIIVKTNIIIANMLEFFLLQIDPLL